MASRPHNPTMLFLVRMTVLVGTLTAAACDRSAAEGPAASSAPMAMTVEAATLSAKPVERTTEYVATVRSRRSTTIQPQVEGFITRIVARPGQRVGRGAVLMEIDSSRQQAAVSNLESVRSARQADLQWARQQAERMKKLYEAGAVSQQEQEQTATALQAAEAQLKAVEAQIAEQRVELGYHRVTAPTSGIVGDIPVRVGDRATRETLLTTIDERAGLELYINVPVAQAPGLRPGLPVRIVDDSGATTLTTAVNFIAPSVDPGTQAVLVKAPIESAAPYRTDQFVRAHIIWSTEPGLTIPVVSVSRINSQYFAFVVQKGDDGTLVARQRAVQLGPVIGNDYLVLSGLTAGEQLVVAGIQKIADGMPVQLGAPAATAPPVGSR